jgi:hypothetical protein
MMPASPHSVDVNYASQCYPLTLGVSGPGEAPTAAPASSAGCTSGQYAAGENIQLTAHPANGYSVVGWSGTKDDSLLSPTNSVSMPASPHTVQVSYALACYPLTLGFNGPGEAPSAAPANSTGCPSGQYIPGEVIQLTAHPANGYRVSGWSGTKDDSLLSPTNSTQMPAGPHTVQVNYAPGVCFSLVLGFSGTGAAPTASPANSTGCPSGRYVPGEVIQLTAHPANHYRVGGWSGTAHDSLASTSNSVTMPSSSHAVIVYYQKDDSPVEPPFQHKILIPLVIQAGR